MMDTNLFDTVVRIVIRGALILVTGGSAWAQCMHWSPVGAGALNMYDLKEFDDGTGPALHAGGESWVKKWDGTTWSYVGAWDSLDGGVACLEVFDDGSGAALLAGGAFSTGLKRWNGTDWVTAGGGVGVFPYDLLVHDDGTGPALFVGGGFTWAGTASNVGGIAKWDGTTWSALQTGVAGGLGGGAWVKCMQTFDDGSGPALFVGGNFTSAGGVPASFIAKWDGSAWSALGMGVNNGVRDLDIFDDGSGPQLYAVGTFTTAGGISVQGIARWNGATWSSVPGGVGGIIVERLGVFDDGNGPGLYVSTSGTTFGGKVRHLLRWDSTGWSAVGDTNHSGIMCLTVYDDGQGPQLYAGGSFQTIGGGIAAANVARWNRCPGPIDSMCFGDRSFADCPCANYGVTGHGCTNSSFTGGALLQPSGSPLQQLQVSGELPTALTIFLQGNALHPWPAQFGDGLRCAGGDLKRLYVKSALNGATQAPEFGDPSIPQRSAALGDTIPSGGIRYYQTYYRDPVTNYCTTSTFNSSNGLRVVW